MNVKRLLAALLFLLLAIPSQMLAQQDALPCPRMWVMRMWRELKPGLAFPSVPTRYKMVDVDGDGLKEIAVFDEVNRSTAIFRMTPRGLEHVIFVSNGYEEIGYAPGGYLFTLHDYHDGPDKHTVGYQWLKFDAEHNIVGEGDCEETTDVAADKTTGTYMLRNESVDRETFFKAIPDVNTITWLLNDKNWVDIDLSAESEQFDNEFDVTVVDKKGPVTNLRDAPQGEIKETLPVNYTYMLTVSQERDGWFKVEVIHDHKFDIPIKIMVEDELWIHGSLIAVNPGVDAQNPKELFAAPKEGSKVVYNVKQVDRFRPLSGSQNGWIKVKVKANNIIGWYRISDISDESIE